MPRLPLLSFIVLSYNYRHYIVETLRSILDQSIQDFEIIVIDDGSTDGSPDLVSTFTDQRIKLSVNPTNLGGPASYNRAIAMARGTYLVNLDADDMIHPLRCEKQLDFMSRHPELAVVGSHIQAIDKTGLPHADAARIETYCNRPLDLNFVNSWIVQNPLCRSSTIIRADAHRIVGGDDEDIHYVCDWELWTRFLRQGFCFGVVPEKLCYYRWHGGNITHRNPKRQFMEIAYLLWYNMMPLIEKRAAYSSVEPILQWIYNHEQFARLHPRLRYRLIGKVMSPPRNDSFRTFQDELLSTEGDIEIETVGRRTLAIARHGSAQLLAPAYSRDVALAYRLAERYRLEADSLNAKLASIGAH